MRIPQQATSARQGLAGEEARRRLAAEGPNELPGARPKSTAALVREVVTEPMFLMLLGAGGLYLALGDRAEALFLLGFVGVVIGITLAQARRTQRALEALRDLSAPRARVVRDGQTQRIASREVVRGDLLVLHEGDRIAADAWLFEGQLSVDESLLTGEAVPVDKTPAPAWPATELGAPGGDGTPFLFASTVITRGTGLAEVRATAGGTAVGRIGLALDTTPEPPSALQTDSRRLVRQLGLAAAVLASALVLLGWLWDGHALLDSLLSGIALAMAILPEEIPVILTVFLALGAWRLSGQRVLARRVSAVEALGAITVLAVDKTGTLTRNQMEVAELQCGETVWCDTPPGSELPEALHPLVEFAMLATPPDPFDPMEQAIQAFGRRHLSATEHVHAAHPPDAEYPLSPDLLAMTRVYTVRPPAPGLRPCLLATKGASEAVADLCHLAPAARARIQHQVEAMAARGRRVLGVAEGRWMAPAAVAGATAAPVWPVHQHDFEFTFLGLIGLADPPRAEVPDAIAQCRQAGVRLLMMTGDHPATASAIARQVGLSDRPEVLNGAALAALDDTALRERLRHVDLCARLQPVHKLRLVQLLQASGEVVAMTGDGVNDAPALKAADVGIAMGERGTDVAREAAALVLLDDRFTSIVAAIRQGRRIYDNIGHAARFTFAVHVPIIALALVPALVHAPVLLLPVHIVLLELLIDPACSVVFEAEPEAADVMTRPPRAAEHSPFSWRNLVDGGLQGTWLAAVLLAGDAWLGQWQTDAAQTRTAVFTALVAGVYLLTLANRSPRATSMARNPWLIRMGAAVLVLLLALMGVPWLRQLMGLAWPTPACALVGVAMVATGAGGLAVLRALRRR
ncbi:cation-translocating P-type ATPase [Sphaerotilus sp.]|uniref:cation-translocating P-type ATPase n=1 Tax=Sphaerotilus sp. TaxID=2093942 RepID=UPI0034E2FAAB